MKLTVIDERVIEMPVRELADRDANRVTRQLRKQGIHVETSVSIFGVVHLWAHTPTTTRQEVTALYAFREVTDCRLAWHEPEEDPNARTV